ncbi:MAG: S1C family serine protease [Planctomycetota bacterium]
MRLKIGRFLCFLCLVNFTFFLTQDRESRVSPFLESLVRVYLKYKSRPAGAEQQTSPKINGVIVSKDGYILTTNYIFYQMKKGVGEEDELVEVEYEKIFVEFYNFKIVEAEYIARDERNDLVLLKIDGTFDRFIDFKEEELNILDRVLVKSLWFDTPTINITEGIISNTERMQNCAYQIDAKVDFASIGGLVTDKNGKPVGIVAFLNEFNAKAYGWGMNSGVGFMVKSKCILNSLQELKRGKNISFQPVPLMGVLGDTSFTDILGAKIKKVFPNTPAHKAGLKDGDIIIKYNDKIITEWLELSYAVRRTPFNSKVVLEVVRDDKKITVEVVLDKKRKEFER